MLAPQLDPDAARLHGTAVPGPFGLRGPGAPANPQVPARTPGAKGINDEAAVSTGAKVDQAVCGRQDATPFPRPAALTAIKQHEGFENYLYLDSVGLITIGYGWNLEAGGHLDTAPQAALDLPFLDRATHQPPTDRAAAVQADWDALRTISKDGTYKFEDKKGKHHVHGASWYGDKTKLYINTDSANNPLQARFDQDVTRFTRDLRGMFPDFDNFPVPAREALLDMAFNMGVGRAATVAQPADKAHHTKARKAHKASGLHAFSHLLADIAKRDWNAAAEDSRRPQVNADRNNWTHGLFTEAAGWECAKPT